MDVIVCYISRVLTVFKQTYNPMTGGCSTDPVTSTHVVDFTSVVPLKSTTLLAFYSNSQIDLVDLTGQVASQQLIKDSDLLTIRPLLIRSVCEFVDSNAPQGYSLMAVIS